MRGKSLTHDGGESYCGIVSPKQPNKSGETPAEAVEKRPQTKENTQQPNLDPYTEPRKQAKRAGACARSSKKG